MCETNKPLRQRTVKPFACELGLRLTPADPEFKLRFQAFEPEIDEDQRNTRDPRLSKVPLVLRLPASALIATFTLQKNFLSLNELVIHYSNPHNFLSKYMRELLGLFDTLIKKITQEKPILNDSGQKNSKSTRIPTRKLFLNSTYFFSTSHGSFQSDLSDISQYPHKHLQCFQRF